MKHWRPHSLAEVAKRAKNGENFDMAVREFVDSYQSASVEERHAMLTEEPIVDADAPAIRKAFLAGLAEFYSRKLQQPAPAWCFKSECFLKRPHFTSALESLKSYLLFASPAEFRKRLIFTDFNPVPRPARTLGEGTVEENTRPKPKIVGMIKI